MSKKQKELDLRVEIIFKDGRTEVFDNPEAASNATGLSENSIKSRCSREITGKKDGICCRWFNEETKRSKRAKRNKNKGNNFELEVINKLKDIGYTGCVSSRSQAKNLDNAKIDIVDINDQLPVNIQCKYVQTTPSYFNIEKECPIKDKPFTIVWKKSSSDGNSPGTIAMIPVSLFYELLKLFFDNAK